MRDWDSVNTYDYPFDEALIAQEPPEVRGASRLLHLDRASGERRLADFSALPGFLRRGDLLVFNDTRVWNARVHGRRASGGRVEILVTRVGETGEMECLLKPAKRLAPGEEILLPEARFRVGPRIKTGARGLFCDSHGNAMSRQQVIAWLESHGELPIPPYIHHQPADPGRYQTVYASAVGSAAAPTAGLHFTPEILRTLGEQGVETAFLTLHVGPGTFLPVYGDRLEKHLLHEEEYEIPPAASCRLTEAQKGGRRIIAIGTTSLRALEDNFRRHEGAFVGGRFRTRIFLRPPQRPGSIQGLLTNFHLPKSTLFMLVCAFGGYDAVKEAYATACEEKFRFFSFGDAMFIS
jgi:S-adenosylmethionine:tRNA ribosyltransferase-isomerase